ncbi:MAG: hypothetical protein M9916_06665 [Crocinitomicaceae bacterium]|nr:hypothetical protein [Crocinitomicaceae bacterium]
MRTHSTAFNIDTILFDNSDTKVLIKGKTIKQHLSYVSELYVSFSELNLLINELQQKNPGIEVADLFIEDQLTTEYSQTIFESKNLKDSTIDLNIFSMESGKKLIRA